MAGPELLTSAEVARRLDFTVQHVRRLVREGRLKGQKFGRDWMIPETSVDAFIASRVNAELPLNETEN